MTYRDFLENRGVETFDLNDDDFLILCPFHADTDPSCEVHYTKGMFYCFSCQAGGNLIKLLVHLEGISYQEATIILREFDNVESAFNNIYNIMFSEADEKEIIRPYSKKSFVEVFRPIEGTDGFNYMVNRKLDLSILKEFGVRYGEFGVWEDRVIFPILDSEGNLMSYSGRSIYDNVQPKIRKARTARTTLFGLRRLIRKYGNLYKGRRFPKGILVEGEIDSIWCQSINLPVVSTMGTAKLTSAQMSELINYFKEIVFLYDGDSAGINAAIRGVDQVRRVIPSYMIELPKESDPNALSEKELKRILRRVL